MKILTSAQLTGATPRVNRTMTLRFVTQEMDSKEKVVLMDLLQEQGWLIFSPNEISEKDIPEENAETEGKTPSQRIRACLFLWWKQDYQEKYPDFDFFYKSQMEKIIDQIKEKLT